jgi:hypothetical protein
LEQDLIPDDEELMKKPIKLISSDETEFMVEARVAFQSSIFNNESVSCIINH